MKTLRQTWNSGQKLAGEKMFDTNDIRRQYEFFYLNRTNVSPLVREILFLLDRIDELEQKLIDKTPNS